jgi:multicomponent Na+:H+ antiporter subunit F
MSGPDLLHLAAEIALGLLSLALLLGLVRLIRGPTLADRILALDLLMTIAMGYVAAVAVLTGFFLFIDIAVAVALVGFLSTLALTRYLLSRGRGAEERG